MTPSDKLPDAKLEAYFIVPLQLANHRKKDQSLDQLYHTLAKHDWQDVIEHELDNIGSGSKPPKNEYNLNHYFHPFVQNFWFENKSNRDKSLVRRFRHKLLREMSITPCLAGEETTIRFEAACDLLVFQPDILLLCLHVRSYNSLKYASMLDCLNEIRRLYPSSFMMEDQDRLTVSGGFPKKIELYGDHETLVSFSKETLKDEPFTRKVDQEYGLPWASHWAYLLSPFSTTDQSGSPYKVTQLGDDRAMITALTQMDFSALDDTDTERNPHPIIDLSEPALTRLCFIDPSNDLTASPYSRHFLEQVNHNQAAQTPFERRYCYDRFWFKEGESCFKPSRMMNCGYAFIWLGPLDDTSFFADEKFGAPKTFRCNYTPMALIAHFQQAKLITLMNQLSQTIQDNHWDEDKLKQCQQDFIHFTQTYWFSEITHQEQGLEMFAIWRQQLRLNTLYDEIRSQLQDVMTHVQTNQAEQLNQRLMIFTVVSLILAGIGVSTGLLGINIFDGKMSDMDISGQRLYSFLVTYSWGIPLIVTLFAFSLPFKNKIKSQLRRFWKYLTHSNPKSDE